MLSRDTLPSLSPCLSLNKFITKTGLSVSSITNNSTNPLSEFHMAAVPLFSYYDPKDKCLPIF
jgi:hypothetical protein